MKHVLMTGHDFLEWMNGSDWADGDYVEDKNIEVDGVDYWDDFNEAPIKPESSVKIKEGDAHLAGEKYPVCLVALARKWVKRQSTSTIVIECHKEKLDALIEQIKRSGGKVVVKS